MISTILVNVRKGVISLELKMKTHLRFPDRSGWFADSWSIDCGRAESRRRPHSWMHAEGQRAFAGSAQMVRPRSRKKFAAFKERYEEELLTNPPAAASVSELLKQLETTMSHWSMRRNPEINQLCCASDFLEEQQRKQAF
jgi:hypothetical protein